MNTKSGDLANEKADFHSNKSSLINEDIEEVGLDTQKLLLKQNLGAPVPELFDEPTSAEDTKNVA